MRLIDADDLLMCPIRVTGNWEIGGKKVKFETIPITAIERAPTVDAVPVVRCRDCIHMIRSAHDALVYCDVWKSVNGHGLDGFCCYGEPKEDGK